METTNLSTLGLRPLIYINERLKEASRKTVSKCQKALRIKGLQRNIHKPEESPVYYILSSLRSHHSNSSSLSILKHAASIYNV